MELSILVPVYNAAPYLRDLVNRIIEANLESAELWLIDDGSTDDSFAICEEYAASYPFIFTFTQKNGGPSSARNAGLKKASGDFIVFLDSDDTIDVDPFKEAFAIAKTERPDVLITDFTAVTDSFSVLFKTNQISKNKIFRELSYFPEFFSKYHCYWNIIRCFFRREFLIENRLFFKEGYNCAEDCAFITEVYAKLRTVVFTHSPYYLYRIHYARSLNGASTLRRLQDTFTMLEAAEEAIENSDFPYKKAVRDKLAREYLFNTAIYTDLPQEDKPLALSLIRAHLPLMNGAATFSGKAAARIMKCFGIPVTALLLNIPKKLRRQLRKTKE